MSNATQDGQNPGLNVSVDNGGVTRVTIGPGASLPEPPATSLGEGVARSGALTMDANTGTIREHGQVAREMISGESDPALGVLASAQSPGGSRSAPITKDSIVTLPNGVKTNVGTAIRLNYLKHDGRGGYAETGKGAEALTPAPQQQAAQPTEVGLLPETEQVISKLESSLPPGMANAFEHALITKGVDVAVSKFAGHSTLGESELLAGANHVAASYQASLAHHLGKQGITLQEFSDWVHANAEAESRSVAYTHATSRRASAWDGLIEQFKQRR